MHKKTTDNAIAANFWAFKNSFIEKENYPYPSKSYSLFKKIAILSNKNMYIK
jgi:hypothetical protein